MSRRTSGQGRFSSQTFAHFRRLAFTRLEDRHVLSALGLELPLRAVGQPAHEHAVDHQPPVAAIAADHVDGSESLRGHGKAVGQQVIDKLISVLPEKAKHAHPILGNVTPSAHGAEHGKAKDRGSKGDDPQHDASVERANPVPVQEALPIAEAPRWELAANSENEFTPGIPSGRKEFEIRAAMFAANRGRAQTEFFDSIGASDSEPDLREDAEILQANALPSMGDLEYGTGANETTQILPAGPTPIVSSPDSPTETGSTELSSQQTLKGSAAVRDHDGGAADIEALLRSVTTSKHRDSRHVAAAPLAAAMPAMPSAQHEAEDAGATNGDAATLAAAIAVADGNAAAESSAPGVGQEVPPQAATHADSSPSPWQAVLLRGGGAEAIARAKEASYDDWILRPVSNDARLGTRAPDNGFSPDRVVGRQPNGVAVRDALFASFSEHAGSFSAWLQFYAMPRNLVSLHHAIETLLAECEDAEAAFADWLLEPGVQPWLEWAAVAMVAAEAARRAAGRRNQQRTADLEGQQLLHLFPELFGLAYGVR